VLPVVPNPGRLLAELHRVSKPTGEIFLVNHVRSDNPVISAVEKGLARFSDKIGFRPDFELRELLHESHELVQIERVNLFWKVMQLKNGVSRGL
jgi:phosphatidylethanolamine/phosphatidyl-N-methylethanolamine N-methyltransferase